MLMSKQMAQAVASLVEKFRPRYLAELEQLAEKLRPRFLSGELHGYRIDADYEAEHVDARGMDPIVRLEARVERELVPDFPTAYLVLACSPSEKKNVAGDAQLADVRGWAAECIVIDAFRLARERGWWKPRRGEYIGQSEWECLSKRAKLHAA